MDLIIYNTNAVKIDETEYEVLERKGLGHPDTIADTLAEVVSAEYSQYTYNKYGYILRHMVDKITLLGGKSKVSFGKGEMVNPIRVLLNGRFTNNFCGEKIDFMAIATKAIRKHFKSIFPDLDVEKWVEIVNNTHSSQGPGVVYNDEGTTRNERSSFFSVADKIHAEYHNNMNRTNDTSTTVSFAPLSTLEQVAIYLETTLNSNDFKKKHPYVGNDIKVMATRHGKKVDITTCIPFIAKHTPSVDFYTEKLDFLNDVFTRDLTEKFKGYAFSINMNTRDNLSKDDVYMTLTGSALESGDEGAVGRGNRSRGVIPFTRNVSLEAPCGKNPVYHTGKLFTAIGNLIADRIYDETGLENVVYMTSQMGGQITNPWKVAIGLTGNGGISSGHKEQIETIVNDELANHNETTRKIISREITGILFSPWTAEQKP